MPPETATAHHAEARVPPPMREAAVECRGVTVEYDGVPVLGELDLVVEPGATLALLGPSGSGKTTLLHAIAGFLAPSDGIIRVAGRIVAARGQFVPPESRSVAMVFQSYALWPHLSALDNVAYPLRRAHRRKHEARAAARDLLDRLGAGELADRRPAHLSGGQQQRVGIARALARRAHVTLLDEPTAHLDPVLRAQVQDVVERVIRPEGGAVVYATHDASEALAVADRIALLREGRVLQIGTPAEIYEMPCDLWAARLTGPASLLRAGSAASLHPRGELPAGSGEHGDESWLVIRPEWTSLGGPLSGRVTATHYRGAYTDYTLTTAAGEVVVRADGAPRVTVGADTTWSLHRAWSIERRSGG